MEKVWTGIEQGIFGIFYRMRNKRSFIKLSKPIILFAKSAETFLVNNLKKNGHYFYYTKCFIQNVFRIACNVENGGAKHMWLQIDSACFG